MFFRRIPGVFRRLHLPVTRHGSRPARQLPEFPTVNARAGTVPVRRELSGLQTRPSTALHHRAARVVIAVAYCWHPSVEYRRRQAEMWGVNRWSAELPTALPVAPPILLFAEENDVAPMRLQPLRGARDEASTSLLPVGQDPRDLRDLEEAERLRAPRVLQPRLAQMDDEYFLGYRPLLPRQYREFLRTSPYPRVAAGIAVVAVAGAGVSWTLQMQQSGALASGRFHGARHAFTAGFGAALAYGVDPSALRTLQVQAADLRATPLPSTFPLSGASVRYYAGQAVAYTRLAHRVQTLERQALRYWTGREGAAFADLDSATHTASTLGLPVQAPTLPACATPACFRRAVHAQRGQAAWLRQTSATLRVYAAPLAGAPDPAAAAAAEVQQARSLARVVPRVGPLPVPLPAIDADIAGAESAAAYARAGALAHLDTDALGRQLQGSLPARAIVISLRAATLTAYLHARVVLRSPIAVDGATPTGRFTLGGRETGHAAAFWSLRGASYRYRFGTIPDWLPYAGSSALQGAPWRTTFGAAAAPPSGYAPTTPGSIDLPPASAAFLYTWATAGTPVLVY